MRFSRTFGVLYDSFMFFLEKFFLNARRARLLSRAQVKVLEIGVGTGVNFKHYRQDVEYVGIEPSPHMIPRARKKRDVLLFPNRFTLHNTGCGYPEMEKLVAPDSTDTIVCTLVLCTVPDPEKALENFRKWLKPGGRLLILEHIRSHNHTAGKMQDMITPVWEKIGEGCQLNRPTDKMIAASGFQLLREDRFNIAIPFYEAEFIKPASMDHPQ
jgi:SAM-dependent methyltransferase